MLGASDSNRHRRIPDTLIISLAAAFKTLSQGECSHKISLAFLVQCSKIKSVKYNQLRRGGGGYIHQLGRR